MTRKPAWVWVSQDLGYQTRELGCGSVGDDKVVGDLEERSGKIRRSEKMNESASSVHPGSRGSGRC